MNAKSAILSLFACLALILASCNNSDDNGQSQATYPNAAIQKTFMEKYPNATDIDFDTEGSYYVADFKNNAVSTSAWFDAQGNWLMEKADIGFDQLPQPVIAAFNQSGYASWKVDEADTINRLGMGVVYKIEVKSGTSETSLYYSQYGNLIKAIDDSLSNDVPIIITDTIKDLMNLTFSGCQLLDIQSNSQGYLLNMLDVTNNNLYKIGQVNEKYIWQSTTWQLSKQDLPAVVLQGFNASAYANDTIEEISTLLNAGGTFYVFIVIHNGQNTTVTFDVFGNIMKPESVLN